MYFKFLVFIALTLLFSACSSVKKTTEAQTVSENFVFSKKDLSQLVINGKMVSSQSSTGSADFKIELFEKDTLAMSIFGPMGMLMIRFFSTENEFILYNSLSNEAFQGSPKSNSLSEFLPIPVNYNDLISIIRNESPFTEESYKEYDINIEKKEKIYKYDSNPDFVEYLVFDIDYGSLKQVQRKLKDGKESLNVFFSNFVEVENYIFPKKIVFEFKKEKMLLTMNCESFIVNKTFEKSLKFGLPASVKINKI